MATAPAKSAKTSAAKSHAPVAKGGGKKTCSIAACKRGYRAKGYCFFHYKKWRRGELPRARYHVATRAAKAKEAAAKAAEAAKAAAAPAATPAA